MTLRVSIDIIPYGNETQAYKLFRLDISNTGLIRDEGFGHQICSYDVKLFRYNNETIQRVLGESEWELERGGVIDEHDRRDGSLKLIRKANEIVGI